MTRIIVTNISEQDILIGYFLLQKRQHQIISELGYAHELEERLRELVLSHLITVAIQFDDGFEISTFPQIQLVDPPQIQVTTPYKVVRANIVTDRVCGGLTTPVMVRA